jgi:outer membrane protein assembly factor BamB
MRRFWAAFTSVILIMLALAPIAASAAIDGSFIGTAPGRFNSIRAQDVDGDGNLEIIWGNYEGRIVVIEFRDGGFREDWRSPVLEYRLWGLDVGDANNDGQVDIVAGGGDGHVYVFDGKTHKRLWESPTIVRDAHGIKVADVDSDGRNDIVVGCGYRTDVPHGRIYVFNWTDHREMFPDAAISREFDAKIRGMAVEDIDRDGVQEIIAGSGVALGEKPGEGYVRVFSGKDGSLKWKSPDTNGDVEGIVVADSDGDGNLEITGGNGYRYFQGYAFQYRFKGEGGVGSPPVYEQVWFSDNIGPKAYGLGVGDIDGDGTKEIVVGNQPGYIWVFDGATRQVKWKSELLGSDILGIALCDIDQDGALEIIAGQGGYQGKADFTSAYTEPHIIIIDGKTKAVEAKLGEQDYLELGFQAAGLSLLITLLAGVSWYARKRKEARERLEELGAPTSSPAKKADAGGANGGGPA